MGYRDEDESLRARVAVLEEELATAKETIARLTGKRAPPVVSVENDSFLLGGPARVVLERQVEGWPGEQGYAAIVALLRARISPLGHADQIGGTLTYRHGMTEITVAPTEEGHARLWLRTSYTQFLSLPMLAGLVAMFTAMPVIGSTLGPLALLWSMPLVGIVAFFVFRAFLVRWMRRQRETLAGVFDAMATIAAQGPRTRVVAPLSSEESEPSDEVEDETPSGPLARTSGRP